MGEKKSFLLRIDAGLWDELQSWADDELRSVNGQIEYLLRETVRARRSQRADKRNPQGAARRPVL